MDDLEDESSTPLTVEQHIGRAIAKLPTLSTEEIPREDSCPICLTPFTSILDGATQDEDVLDDVAANPIKLHGVTKLDGCGHVFCRTDLIEWIRGRHGTCPACRHVFLDIKPPTDSDNESSDGSDYVPDDEDEDEDDGFVDTEDDWEFEAEMDLDACDEFNVGNAEAVDADLWEDHDDGMDNWGLSDGDGSESLSEGDIPVSYDGEAYIPANMQIFTTDDESLQSASASEDPSLSEPKP